MPLRSYGVAIGTYARFYRDPPDEFGNWYHGHLEIDTPAGRYTSALDVDTPSGVGVSVKRLEPLDAALFTVVSGRPNGWHVLASNSTSGALDYLRSELLLDRCPPPSWWDIASGWWWRRWLEQIFRWLRYVVCLAQRRFRGWVRSSGDAALTALEGSLPGSRRIYIFGEPFRTGLGVHNVHMNQGDPAGSRWWESNGIWQDGAVIVEKADGTLAAWLVKFNTQSLTTDDAGHPV